MRLASNLAHPAAKSQAQWPGLALPPCARSGGQAASLPR